MDFITVHDLNHSELLLGTRGIEHVYSNGLQTCIVMCNGKEIMVEEKFTKVLEMILEVNK